jgi:leader peptidase (prepilin peptidase) / N-methyltransferase
VLLALVILLGLAIGSFLNVVVHRVPRGESVVRPPSACPACGAAIRPKDNVPVLGWVLLRGRCRDCGEPISPRYPLVELGTAALFAVMALRFGYDWVLPAYLYLAAVMYGVYFALCFAYPAGMGFGDVKLAGVLGLFTAWLGWGVWAVGLFLGFFLGGLFGAALIALRRGGRKTAVPFGPFMLAGVLVAVLFGRQLVDAYLGATGL